MGRKGELITYEEAVAEITRLKALVSLYQKDPDSLKDVDYPGSIKRLMYLKNRLPKLRKKD